MALTAELPFVRWGTASGHDIEFHLYSWLEVLAQWKHGTLYPSWAGFAHYGYGEPRFIFYPPASWTLGALLTAIFPWRVVPEIYIWLALTGAGAGMLLLAREFLDLRDATFAAALYAVNPYHLAIIYWRSAFAELLASCLPPLLLLLCLRLGNHARGAKIWLGVLLAAAWLINAPAAVMIHYSLALLLLVLAWSKRSPQILLSGVAAIALGAALASFYLVPAVYEQKWVNISDAVSPGSQPSDNFLFVHTADADHDAFNRAISSIIVTETILTIIAAWAALHRYARQRSLWLLAVIWAGACVVFMTPVSNSLWSVLPELRFMQFPWRWTLCLSVPFALLTAIGIRKWWVRGVLYAVALCAVALAWQHFQAPWWDTVADLREMQDNIATGAGYEGTDEYTPFGADGTSVDKTAAPVKAEGDVEARVNVTNWSAKKKEFTAQVSESDAPETAAVMSLHLFNYPAWKVEVNGHQVQPATKEGTGQMLIPVRAGMNSITIKWTRTWDRTAGMWISLLALVLTMFLLQRHVSGGNL